MIGSCHHSTSLTNCVPGDAPRFQSNLSQSGKLSHFPALPEKSSLGEKNYSICSQTSYFSLMFLNIWFNLFNMFNFDLISYAESSSPFDYPIQLEVKSAKLISLQLYYNIYFKFSWGYFCDDSISYKFREQFNSSFQI